MLKLDNTFKFFCKKLTNIHLERRGDIICKKKKKLVIQSIQLKIFHKIIYLLMKSMVGIIISLSPKAKRHYTCISKSWVEFKLGLNTFGPYIQPMLDRTCLS